MTLEYDPGAGELVRDPQVVVTGERSHTLREAVELVVVALVPKDFRIFPDRSRNGTYIVRVTAREQARTSHTLRILDMVNEGALDALSVTTRTRPFRAVALADLDAYVVTHAGLVRFCEDAAISVRIAEEIEPQVQRKPKRAAPDWQAQARTLARKIIARDSARGFFPSQVLIAEEIERQFREAGTVGLDGKPLAASYIKRHALKGITSGAAECHTAPKRRGK